MKLRNQLGLVSVVALLLPWAGCTYVQEMESALRRGQQDALAQVTRSLASSFDRSEALVAQLRLPEVSPEAGADIYLNDVPAGTVIDGYVDGSEAIERALLRFGDAAFGLGLYAGIDARRGYLYLSVADAGIVYRNPQSTRVDESDHVVIDLVDRAGQRHLLWLSPEAPGEVTAFTRDGRSFVPERKVRGVWRDTVEGYSVEVQLPRDWLGVRLGAVAVDGEDTDREVGSMRRAGEPGRLIRRSRDIEIALEPFKGDNLRLTIVDAEAWVRAANGTLADTPTEPLAPGAWMIAALYKLLTDTPVTGSLQPGFDGKLQRAEVMQALKGEPASAWYSTGEDLAVVSAAVPLSDVTGIRGAVIAEQTTAGTLSLTNAALVRLVGLSFGATALIFCCLIGYAIWLSARIARLGRDVARVMDEDARELGSFPPQSAQDEIGALGRRFGRLFERLAGYTDYLKTLASKLSHELRTPLAVVRSSIDNLEHEDLSERGRDYVARARAGSDRLERILTAMSAASRVEQSIRFAEKEPVELVTWLRESVAAYASTYPMHRFECESAVDALTLNTCPDLLAQMLDKLVDNARDFCPPQGRIGFALNRFGNEAVLSVTNDGPPLPEGMADQLFESMVSVRESGSDEVHMGLGLTVVRLIVDFHGGRVTAANTGDGTGVVFTVRLPL